MASSPEEAAKLRELLDLGTDHPKALLLIALRKYDGDVDAATAALLSGEDLTPKPSAPPPAEEAFEFESEASNNMMIPSSTGEMMGSAEPSSGDNTGAPNTFMGMGGMPNPNSTNDDDPNKAQPLQQPHFQPRRPFAARKTIKRISMMHGGIALERKSEEKELQNRYERKVRNDDDDGSDDEQPPPRPAFTFINEGIRIIEIDLGVGRGQGTDDACYHEDVIVDIGSISDTEFQERCKDWLLEEFSSDENCDANDATDEDEEGDETSSDKELLDPESPEALAKRAKRSHKDPTALAAHRAYLDDILRLPHAEREKRIKEHQATEEARLRAIAEEAQFQEDLEKAMYESLDAEAKKKMDEQREERKKEREAEKAKKAKKLAFEAKVAAATFTPGTGKAKVYSAGPSNSAEKFKSMALHMTLPKNCGVVGVQTIINPVRQKAFLEMKQKMTKAGYDVHEEYGYHGTATPAVKPICSSGFIAPLKRKLQHKSGNDGWYGNGIYISPDPDTARCYASDNRLIVCLCLRGKSFYCPGLMMGAPLQKGFTCHVSPDGHEWVFYEEDQVLPVALIHFDYSSWSSDDRKVQRKLPPFKVDAHLRVTDPVGPKVYEAPSAYGAAVARSDDDPAVQRIKQKLAKFDRKQVPNSARKALAREEKAKRKGQQQATPW